MSETYRKLQELREAERQRNEQAIRDEAQRVTRETAKKAEEDRKRVEAELRKKASEQEIVPYAVDRLSQSPAVEELISTFMAIGEHEWHQPLMRAVPVNFKTIYNANLQPTQNRLVHDYFPLHIKGVEADKERDTLVGHVDFILGVKNTRNGLMVASTLGYSRGLGRPPSVQIGILTSLSTRSTARDDYTETSFLGERVAVARSIEKAIRGAQVMSLEALGFCDCYQAPSSFQMSCNCGP